MVMTKSSGGPGIEDSQGTTFVFDSKAFKATKVEVDFGGGSTTSSSNQIDVSHLGLASGSDKEYQSPPLNEVTSTGGTGVIATIDIDFLGLEKPNLATHGIDCGAKLQISGQARCTAYTLTAAVNDVLKGTATFELTSKDGTYTPIVPTP